MNNQELNHLAERTPMSNGVDPDTKQWLAQWEAPRPPARLDAQLHATYRKQFPPRTWWQRWLSVSIRLPVPVAVAAGLALCVMSWVAAQRTSSIAIQPASDTTQTKLVEVPVIQEKIVTRLIYVKTRPVTSSKPGLNARRAPTSRQSPAASQGGSQADLAGLRPVTEIKIAVNHGGQLQ
jgi:hypothetical protein